MNVPMCLECGHCHFKESPHVKGPEYQPFKPYVDYMLDAKPVYVDSPRTRERWMKTNKLDWAPRRHPDDIAHSIWKRKQGER